MIADTIAENQQRHGLGGKTDVWLFGYGSLIFKVDFPFLEKRPASIKNWQRRFWQGSHDHRGTPSAPGRVVTLMAAPNSICSGMAYKVSTEVFEHLDFREKNGYLRFNTELYFDDDSGESNGRGKRVGRGKRAGRDEKPDRKERAERTERNKRAQKDKKDQSNKQEPNEKTVVYIATENNAAFLGEASEQAIATHIAQSRGPSGENSEYLILLAEALRELDADDPHVFAIEQHLRPLLKKREARSKR